jgi:hypothetical protein
MTTLGELIFVPPDLLYPDIGNDQQKSAAKVKRDAYAALPDTEKMNPANEHGGRWWSLHHLMKKFGSGFLPDENDATYIGYRIDFTAPELKNAKSKDPLLASSIDQNMLPGLKEIENKTIAEITAMQQQSAQQLQQGVMAGLSRGNQGPAGPTGAPVIMDPVTGAPVPQLKPYSAENLEAECFADLYKIVLSSKSCIYVTDGHSRAIQLGGKKRNTRKVRKGRKYSKKSKTHRRHRR